MDQPTVIRVENIKKDFHLPRHKPDSIKEIAVGILRKKDKAIDVHHALKGVSFEIKKGEFFGILGRNGSGKSTLLKILAQIYMPTEGKAWHKGKLVPFIELGVGFKPNLTGRENVYLNGALLGFSTKEIDAKYNEIVKFAELEEFMDQKLKNYSSGMKVRLAFSVAIQSEADILLLDEVLAVGDADFQKKCYKYFDSLKEDKSKTIIFVSHSMSAVRDYCDRAILIENGKITYEGRGEDTSLEYLRLFNKPKYEKAKKILRGDRWGSGEVEITEVRTEVDSDKLLVKVELLAYKTVKSTIVGLDIYDHKNNLIGGVADRIQAKNNFGLKKNTKKVIEYQFDNIFGSGQYTINLGVRSKVGGEVFDFWKNAKGFTNNVDVDEYFPVALPVNIKMTNS